MATIANNHLSEGARQRAMLTGDTEMYTTKSVKPGSTWDVSPQEKQFMNMYGAEGERMVDAIGAGTINPYTGNEEKFLGITAAGVMAATAIGGAITGAYSDWKSGNIQEQTAQAQVTAADEGLEAIRRSRESLMDKTQAGRQLLSEKANVKWDELSNISGVKKGTLIKESAKVKGKQNLYKSGSTDEITSESMEQLAFATESAQGTIESEYGESLGTLAGEHAAEMKRLKSEEERINREKTLAQEQADSWYMGKHVGKTLQSIVPGGQKGYSWGL